MHSNSPPARGLHRTRAVAPLALATSTLVTTAACAHQNSATATVPQTSAPRSATAAPTVSPLTIENCGRKVTFDKVPSRVVLLNGTSVGEAESFIALGISDRNLANSQSYGASDDPAIVGKVAAVPTSGLTLNQNFEVPREQVLARKPDLMILTWAGGFDEKIGSISRDQLTATGSNSFVMPVNRAFGDPAPRPEDDAKDKVQSAESSSELLLQLRQIFDVQQRAADLVNQSVLVAIPVFP